MRLRRDPYHDYVTAEDICNAGYMRSVQQYSDAVADALWERSGGRNTRAALMTMRHDPNLLVTTYSVSFDSAAWTG